MSSHAIFPIEPETPEVLASFCAPLPGGFGMRLAPDDHRSMPRSSLIFAFM